MLGGLVLLLTVLGLCVFIISNDEYKKIIVNSESVKILAANFVLPDFQDVQSKLNIDTVTTMFSSLPSVQDALGKAWEFTSYTTHQFSISTKETCSNILNFINTIIVEIKSGETFKDTSKTPLEASINPNDDSEDYTPELNDWIESQETPKANLATVDTENEAVEGNIAPTEQSDYVKEKEEPYPPTKSIDINIIEELNNQQDEIEPSFKEQGNEASINVATVSETLLTYNETIDEPIIEKTTVRNLG